MQEKLVEFGSLGIAFALYPLLACAALKFAGSYRWIILAIIGVLLTYATGLALTVPAFRFAPSTMRATLQTETKLFAVYIALVILCYLSLRLAIKNEKLRSLAYLTPIFCLILARDLIPLGVHTQRHSSVFLIFLGVSYVFFRLCFLANEVLNGIAPKPNIDKYFAFAFYLPLMFVGPISRYSLFLESISRRDVRDRLEATYRILSGLVKYIVLSSVLAEFSYGPAFLRDGHLHSKLDLVLAVAIYPLFLYCNFSGMCDIAIGTSSLLGISIDENFNNPFSSRNFQEFWTRWHITLSSWMRDLVFTPLVKFLARRFGTKGMDHYIPVGILVVFLAIGAWHSPTSHFIVFGALQGLGVVTIHYGNLFLKRRLSKEKFRAFKQSKRLNILGALFTYSYFAATLFLFANTFQDAKDIFSHLG